MDRPIPPVAQTTWRGEYTMSRIIDLKLCAKHLGVCPSIIRIFVTQGLLKPLSLPGRTGNRIQKLLFDMNDVDALIDEIKRGSICQNEGALKKDEDVSSNQKDEISGISNTLRDKEKQNGSQQEQQIESKQKDSVLVYFQKWKEEYR